MRFTLAAAILAQALPASTQGDAHVVSSLDMSSIMTHDTNKKAAIKNALLSKSAQGKNGVKGIKPVLNQFSKKKNVATASTGVECKPDIGVLSCGTGMYCKSDETTNLGGICTPAASTGKGGRKLLGGGTIGYTYCVKYVDYFDCDCTEWDAESGSGEASCDVYSGYCFEACPNICFDAGGSYSSDGENWVYSVCTNFTSPIEQQYCSTTNSDGTCEITLDGVACTSCEMVSECGSFNCENVGMGSGTFCNDTYPEIPIFSSCERPFGAYYDPCSICSDGMAYPDNQVGDAETGYISCYYLGYFAYLGYFDEFTCFSLQLALQTTCCGVGVYECNLCGDDGMYITEPYATVTFPDNSTETCALIQTASELGVIYPEICPYFVSYTSEACGCAIMATDTPTTVSPPPTEAPSVASTDAPTMSPTMEADTTEAPTGGSGATSTTSSSKLALTAGICVAALVAILSTSV